MSALEPNETQTKWRETISRITPAIVSIKIRRITHFAGGLPGISQATGFVVDKSKGLVLTNRHVAKACPQSIQLFFQNKEKVNAKLVYNDPVHDFAFLQYTPLELYDLDPSFEPKIEEIPLYPAGAKVGVAIRVIGNDAGEKLSILSGTIARLDRNAPQYHGTYSDFNTFYYGAASSTSGGSSGSPVVNVQGQAVALNAGGKNKAASSYYLPLDRVVRALEKIRAGVMKIPRGTIQAIFKSEEMSTLRGLGVDRSELKEFDLDEVDSLLVVSKVVSQGSAHKGCIQHGDVLLAVNGKPIRKFVELESELDQIVENYLSKGGTDLRNEMRVYIKVHRGGVLDVELEVEDLDNLEPRSYCEVSGGTFQKLSYVSAAKSGNLPAGCVFMTKPFFLSSLKPGAVLKEIIKNGVTYPENKGDVLDVTNDPLKGLISFEECVKVFQDCKDGDKLLIRFFYSAENIQMGSFYFENEFHGFSSTKYERSTDTWVTENILDVGNTVKTLTSLKELRKLVHPIQKFDGDFSLCQTTMFFQCAGLIDDVYSKADRSGVGYFISDDLLLTSRYVVPNSLGRVFFSLCGRVNIPCRVILSHPTLNYSVVKMSLHRLSEQEYSSYKMFIPGVRKLDMNKYSDEEYAPGTLYNFIGIAGDGATKLKGKDAVLDIEEVIPELNFWPCIFQPLNCAIFRLSRTPKLAREGLFYTKDFVPAFLRMKYAKSKKGAALYAVFNFAEIVKSCSSLINLEEVSLNPLLKTSVKSFGAKLFHVMLSKLQGPNKISPERFQDGKTNKAFVVSKTYYNGESHKVLSSGDIVLALDGEEVNLISQVSESRLFDKEEVALTLQKDQKEVIVKLRLQKISVHSSNRWVEFLGIRLVDSYTTLPFGGFLPIDAASGKEHKIFVHGILPGSTASLAKVSVWGWLSEIEGCKVYCLEDLIDYVMKNEIEDGKVLSVGFHYIKGRMKLKRFGIRMDKRYFSTKVFRRNSETGLWIRAEL
eukprot:augustus_masked-scaffold_3-processed-gene-9.65-mRNA-1 protein AED:0.30 eAED:0.30 QI:0/-1/0/1/-1/1/1/0/986